jgi:hypothetical protein
MPLPYMKKDSSSVRLCWSPEGLWVAADIADRSVETAPEQPWEHDCVELYVDKALSRPVRADRHTEQYAFFPRPGKDLWPAGVFIPYGSNVGKEGQVESAWYPVEGGYRLEVLIPAAMLAPASMTAGTRLGMNFAVSDDGRAVEQFHCDKVLHHGWNAPVRWGVVELVE